MAMELSEWSHSRSSWALLHSDDRSEQATSETPRKPQFQSGWRFSLLLGTTSCIVVFVINLVVTIWATTRKKKNMIGLPVLREGRCSDMRHWNSGLHLLINALSSILLAASNYAMQCICAPTRADINKAHSEGKWLDIGVPSAHNLNHIPKNRYRLWLVLAVTSLPLHLVYNSVVFSSLATVSYDIWTVHSQMGNSYSEQYQFFNRDWSVSDKGRIDEALKDLGDNATDSAKQNVTEEIRQTMLKEGMKWTTLTRLGVNNELQKLTNLECIRRFATSFQTSHQSLILVTSIAKNPELQGKATFQKNINIIPQRLEEIYSWICGAPNCTRGYRGPCHSNIPALEKAADTWAPWCDMVEYCYSEPMEERCQLTFSPTFMAFVLVSNVLKAIVLHYVASRPPDEALFVLGDAIESFMTVPDAFSNGSCLASVDDIRQKNLQDWTGPRIWFLGRSLWGSSVSPRRWKTSILLYLVSLSLVLFFLIFSVRRLPDLRGMGIPGTLWRLGFGAVTELTLIKRTEGGASDSFTMTQSVLLASLPHLIFSSLYFQYNALFTGMLAAKEWSDFGRKRKGLRVSSEPRGEQRARYFLQLPYRWSIPLILMSMTMHWMLSQSIFIVPIEFENEFITTCGYSPMAIVAVFIAGIIMAVAVIITACRRLPTAMPVVGSCSLGIAAACHGLEGTGRPDDPLVPVRWGAMAHPEDDLVVGKPGHCGFSGGYVEEPQDGGLYS